MSNVARRESAPRQAAPPERLPDAVLAAFRRTFGGAPATLVRAPGRVNLIGDHTDYNDGFVLPLAIERAVWIALRPCADREVHVTSLALGSTAHFRADAITHGDPPWSEYVRGTAWALATAGHVLEGWEGMMASDVPIGAGLSSSAALEMATARAFAEVSGLRWDAGVMARLAQRAENEWVGMQCGIMDQMISAAGVAGHALLIDCRSLETRAVPLPAGCSIVVLDTATRRGLVESAYNERRRQCTIAAGVFGVPALRDVELPTFEAHSGALDPVIARRARHVITENARTLAAADAMAQRDAVALGRLMDASHASLRDDYEVSTQALDTIVEIARAQPGCLGARMTGAGFGGCAVALVETAATDTFAARVTDTYSTRMQRVPHIYITGASAGASVVELPA